MRNIKKRRKQMSDKEKKPDIPVEDKEGDLSFDSAQDDKMLAPDDKNPDNNDEMNGHVRSLPDMVERLLEIYHLSIVGGDKILIRGKSVPIADEDVEFIKANKDKFLEKIREER